MKIAYQHLLRFLIDKPSIKDLSDKLFQLGHEHEIEGNIFDMEFTPNRGDCLSLLGLARDLNVFYQTTLELDSYDRDIPFFDFDFKNNEHLQCPKISFLNIEIKGDISKYKSYLEDYFSDFKINKNNFFTDVSNYIAYEMGQPTHSYDFSLIEGNITLEKTKTDSTFKTLLDKDIKLKKYELTFNNKNKVINLAGVIGGKDTACSHQTNNALIECAYFEPESIIGKSLKYDLRSEASHKFERGVDPECHESVLRRFIQIVDDHAQITNIQICTNEYIKFRDTNLKFDLEKINNIIGINESKKKYSSVLKNLGFKINDNIKVPSFRHDIAHQNDLAEEFARVIGYNNIPTKKINLSEVRKNSLISLEDKLKFFLIDNGFFEVINPPFRKNKESNSISIDNPLDLTRKYLRTNIVDSLVENLIFNEKRQKDAIKFFEISDLYSLQDELLQDKNIGLIISGRAGHNHQDFSQQLDRDYLIDLFKKINFNIENEIIRINRSDITSKKKTPIFALEIKLSKFNNFLENYQPIKKSHDYFVQYEPISEFPSTYRDFSFSISDSSKIEELNIALSSYKSKYLKQLFMFDFFENKKTNEIKVGYRLIFQSHAKTLTDSEVDKIVDNIISPVLSIKSISLPGIKK